MLALLLAAVTVTTPFEDVQKRFHVDLPPGWNFAPQPGDTAGAFFRRDVEGMQGNAAVRVIIFPNPITVEAFVGSVAAATDHDPGFRLLANEPVIVAGLPGVRRRYVVAINGDVKWPKMVEQRFLVAGGLGYIIHVETVADAFGVFEEDFGKLFASFRPGPLTAGEEAAQVEPRIQALRQSKGVGGRVPIAKAIVGRWSGGGHNMQFGASGIVTFDAFHGTYRFDEGTLVLQVGDQQLIFEYSMTGATLRLAGGLLGDGQDFRRVAEKTRAAPASP